jgi:NADPH:quinone reductase-like Zn-dependent oxidoreductase
LYVYEIPSGTRTIDGLRRERRPEPKPGAREILIRIRAVSLNYRDHAILTGRYFGGPVSRDVIPVSDGAGEVLSIGPGVNRFKPGDRVAGTFFQGWTDGSPPVSRASLGVPLDGMLAEYVALSEEGAVEIPASLSYEEAATLPCAGVTAWNALMIAGARVKPGDNVLCLGTGGVSMFGLQFARAAGARVIITSSSDEKLERARALGAAGGVNYKHFPDWGKEVLNLTGGSGADHILEVGGPGTLARSFQCAALGGKIALIGFLAGTEASADPLVLMMKNASMHGIRVGSRAMFEEMNRAIEVNAIKPVIDRVFPFDEAPEAFQLLASGSFMGKIVISLKAV